MQRITMRPKHVLTLLFAGMLAASPAFADKPEWAGGGKSGKHEQKRDREREDDRGAQRDRRSHFGDHEREIAHGYFAEQYRAGRCPPGLAKKHNGCMPPGQAKKWMVGRPLPHDVIYYDLPPSVVVQLGPPPTRHRYVRVASDILLIAIGTGMVVDAIEDIGRQ